MNYGELKTYFLDVLNRSDITDEQTDTFISMGIRRAERLLRTPIQKSTHTETIDETWTGSIPAPTDYLGMYGVRVNDVPVPRISLSQTGDREGFLFEDGSFSFYPDLKEGDVVEIIYYSEFVKEGLTDTSQTRYSIIMPDLAVYAALVFASDTFVDERKGSFESTLGNLVTEIQNMADMDELTGGMSITPYGGGIV